MTRKTKKAAFRAHARRLGITLAQAKMLRRGQPQGMAALLDACLKALS